MIYFHYIDWETKLEAEAHVLFHAVQTMPYESFERLQLQELHPEKGTEGKPYKLAPKQVLFRSF